MEAYDIVIGIDPGLQGGITIFDKDDNVPKIFKIPLTKIKHNKKNKNVYDMKKIVDIFNKYVNKKVLFCIEKQGVRPGEGAVSALTIGKGFGQLLGVGFAFQFTIIEITPQTWKKMFTELVPDEISILKESLKKLKAEAKTLKDKEAKKLNKKEIDILNRKVKTIAKDSARLLVATKYPNMASLFEKKNSDGIAESVLIALYAKTLK